MEDTVFSSFVDIGAGARGNRQDMDDDDVPVPPILYAVQYYNSVGKMMSSRTSPTPIDVDEAFSSSTTTKKKPILEIRTSVTAPSSKDRTRYQNDIYPPPRRPRPYSDSEADSASDASLDLVCVPPAPSRGGALHPSPAEMIIHSPHLCAALSAVVGYYSGFTAAAEGIVVEEPYQVLFHHRDELRAYKDAQPSVHDAAWAAATVEHVDVLLGFLEGEFAEKLEGEKARWENPEGGMATYDNFWMLLKPGGVVYKEKEGEWRALVVSDVQKHEEGTKESYSVWHWEIAYRRGALRRRQKMTVVRPWNGERRVDELPIVPARFVPGGEEAMAEKQVELGKMYWELAKQPAYREYDGLVIERDGKRTGNMTGRVIVDCEGWERFRDGPDGGSYPPRNYRNDRRRQVDTLPQTAPRCPCKACTKAQLPQTPGPFFSFDNLKPAKSPLPPNASLYLHILSTTIPAFILPQRTWGTIQIARITPVRPDPDAFSQLVLDPSIKLTVRALISKFTPATPTPAVTPWPSDFIKSKGEGRIFLLHGPPGVGKTCTAECIAELTHRPLLALTSGDISTTPSAISVERSLSYFLALGERFGALVLLDEADVYLEARRTRDLHRNGLVSMFLRALEYYRGVLFLTTNRVEAFDSAFTSRIHVALRYRALGDEDRARIWGLNIERLERESGGRVTVPEGTRKMLMEGEEVRGLKWNGREIRNAMQTAVALAEAEAEERGEAGGKVVVGEECVRAVVRMSRGFKEYLGKRKGKKVVVGAEEDESDDVDDAEKPEYNSEESGIGAFFKPVSVRVRRDDESESDGYES
ncbi:hypothetical protein QBC39DRAFT_395224 [Podospora conica]|nr:hypothetical protein QBC39DRAFT_395224 [Schizothecium conicum]